MFSASDTELRRMLRASNTILLVPRNHLEPGCQWGEDVRETERDKGRIILWEDKAELLSSDDTPGQKVFTTWAWTAVPVISIVLSSAFS